MDQPTRYLLASGFAALLGYFGLGFYVANYHVLGGVLLIPFGIVAVWTVYAGLRGLATVAKDTA